MANLFCQNLASHTHTHWNVIFLVQGMMGRGNGLLNVVNDLPIQGKYTTCVWLLTGTGPVCHLWLVTYRYRARRGWPREVGAGREWGPASWSACSAVHRKERIDELHNFNFHWKVPWLNQFNHHLAIYQFTQQCNQSVQFVLSSFCLLCSKCIDNNCK